MNGKHGGMFADKKNKKVLIATFSGIAVFIIGAILGSFLVLRSHTGEGKTFFIQSNNLANSNARSSLLNNLRELSDRSLYPPISENLSDVAIQSFIEASKNYNRTINELAEDDDFYNLLLPYIKDEVPSLIVDVPEDRIRLDGRANEQAYLSSANQHMLILQRSWRTINNIDPDNIASPAARASVFNALHELSLGTSQFQKIAVPPQHKKYHAMMLQFSVGMHRLFADGILGLFEDPLTASLLLEQAANLEDLGRQIDAEYARIIKEQL